MTIKTESSLPITGLPEEVHNLNKNQGQINYHDISIEEPQSRHYHRACISSAVY